VVQLEHAAEADIPEIRRSVRLAGVKGATSTGRMSFIQKSACKWVFCRVRTPLTVAPTPEDPPPVPTIESSNDNDSFYRRLSPISRITTKSSKTHLSKLMRLSSSNRCLRVSASTVEARRIQRAHWACMRRASRRHKQLNSHISYTGLTFNSLKYRIASESLSPLDVSRCSPHVEYSTVLNRGHCIGLCYFFTNPGILTNEKTRKN